MSGNERSTEQILRFLDRHGVVDKDSRCPVPRQPRRRPRYDTEIDLHGLTTEQAEKRIDATLTRCKRTGAKKVLIVHGKGLHSCPRDGPVLKSLLFQLLENRYSSLISSYRAAPPRDGGQGATIVYL